jgi:hypothetical protein
MGCWNGTSFASSPQTDFIVYCAEQPMGGHMGLFALATGAANDRANRAAAMQSIVFFTLKLLVEVELAGR